MKILNRILILAAISVCLSGCVAAVAGGAAAGGYYIGKDPRSAGQIADDGVITTKVKSKLIASSDVSALDINVDTYENVVVLKGTVNSARAKSAAIEIARNTSGVRKVISELVVDKVEVEDRR
ncbi:MAG: BON domain-containing protein [Pseudomonadales bacterium]|nr:BON domain-containing protein [Pseudomonadales bacterium]